MEDKEKLKNFNGLVSSGVAEKLLNFFDEAVKDKAFKEFSESKKDLYNVNLVIEKVVDEIRRDTAEEIKKDVLKRTEILRDFFVRLYQYEKELPADKFTQEGVSSMVKRLVWGVPEGTEAAIIEFEKIVQVFICPVIKEKID